MQRIDATSDLSTLAASDATASTLAGGQAYLADVARRLAPYCARSQSCQRGIAYLRGLRSATERKHSWQVAEICGESPLWLPVFAEPGRLGRGGRAG